MRLSLTLLVLALCAGFAAHAAAEDVTIYRCTDAKGKLTLRDSPCKRGEKQQTQTMLRPRDARPAPVIRNAGTRNAAPAETVRYVVQASPRTLYACVAPDGREYTSESPEGNPRWVPLWTVDAPYYGGHPAYPPTVGRYGGEFRYRDRYTSVRIGGGRETIGAPVTGYPVIAAPVAGGTWVRDACEPMTASESCAVMSDRRYAISRRYAQAMPSERSQLDRESATLDSRLRQECGQ